MTAPKPLSFEDLNELLDTDPLELRDKAWEEIRALRSVLGEVVTVLALCPHKECWCVSDDLLNRAGDLSQTGRT